VLDLNFWLPPASDVTAVSQTVYYMRIRSKSARSISGATFFTSTIGSGQYKAALYTVDGTRRAVCTGAAGNIPTDLSTSSANYVIFDAAYTVAADTDYYVALWFNLTAGSVVLAGTKPPLPYVNTISADGSHFLLANQASQASGPPATAVLTGITAYPGIPLVGLMDAV
jgi:hypothetical protein